METSLSEAGTLKRFVQEVPEVRRQEFCSEILVVTSVLPAPAISLEGDELVMATVETKECDLHAFNLFAAQAHHQK